MRNFKLRGKTKPSRSIKIQPGKKSTNIQGLKPRSGVKTTNYQSSIPVSCELLYSRDKFNDKCGSPAANYLLAAIGLGKSA